MTVNISKPSINIREKLSELDKPSGIAGEAVLRADSVQEIRNQIGAGRKNLIINGGMQVSQRGTYTSATTASDNSYYIDRWKDWSGIARTIQNTTVTLNNISNTKAVKYTATATSASSYMGTRQMVEGDFFPNGAVVTASCYMRTNNANARIRTYGVVSGGVTSSACPSDGAWHKVSLTQTSSIVGIPEVGVLVYDADETPTAIATGDYIEFTHFQLELGSVATEFEHRSYGEELALCQRYYYAVAFLNTGVYNSDSQVFCTVNAPSTFRVTPSVSMKSGTYTNINVEKNDSYTITNVAFSHGTTQEYFKYNPLVVLTMPTRSGYAGQAGMVSCDRNNDAFVFDAEL